MKYTKVELKDLATGFGRPAEALAANREVFAKSGQVQRIDDLWYCWKQVSKQKVWVRSS